VIRAWWEVVRLIPIIAWRTFDEWAETLPARMDEWTARFRENTGQEPDWSLERRRAKRRAER